jgi:hypothetical protein
LGSFLSVFLTSKSDKPIATRDLRHIVETRLIDNTSGINITVSLEGSSKVVVGDAASKPADIYSGVDL